MDKYWMIIYTKPRAEKKVEQRLIERGIEAYCPTYITLKQWSDRKKKVELPLLPSYVFVKTNELERMLIIQESGAMNFVFWQGKPAVVRTQEIKALQKEMLDILVPEAEVGDYIVIEEGPFKGTSGKVKHVSKNQVVLVLENLGILIRLKR
jgi:transcriptional antiterminator RfaH